MENINTSEIKSTTTKTIWTFLVLLILAVIFWKWSITYRSSEMMNATNTMEMNTATTTADDQLKNDIDASMNSGTEIELRSIDSEFPN